MVWLTCPQLWGHFAGREAYRNRQSWRLLWNVFQLLKLKWKKAFLTFQLKSSTSTLVLLASFDQIWLIMLIMVIILIFFNFLNGHRDVKSVVVPECYCFSKVSNENTETRRLMSVRTWSNINIQSLLLKIKRYSRKRQVLYRMQQREDEASGKRK